MPATPAKAQPLLKNSASAPFVYFDGAPVFGVANGNIEIELSARVLMPKIDGAVGYDFVCTAHLRCTAAGATSLGEAITKALALMSDGDQARH